VIKQSQLFHSEADTEQLV